MAAGPDSVAFFSKTKLKEENVLMLPTLIWYFTVHLRFKNQAIAEI